MPPAGVHTLSDIDVYKPNAALGKIMASPNMAYILEIFGEEVVRRYQAKVAKDSGDLMRSAKVQPSQIGGKKNDRMVGKVTVGGYGAIGYWKSARNPNPGNQFYYGVLHEHGSPTKRSRFPAAKDLAEVMLTPIN